MGAPEIKRGDVYYIRFDDSYGSEEAVGRPAVVVSGDIGNRTSPIVNVLYMTTGPRTQSINVEVSSTKRRSWVLCDQIRTFDKNRFGDYMCTLSPTEMKKIDNALSVALGLNIDDGRHEEEMRNLVEEHQQKLTALEAEYKRKLKESEGNKSTDRVEADLYKNLYERVLEMLTEKKLQEDISPKISEVPENIPPKISEEPVVVVESEPEEQKVDVNSCSENDLIKIGLGAPLAKMVITSRPFQSVDDLRMVHGMTGIAYQVLRHKVTAEPVKKPEPVKPKVNINTATAEEIHERTGLSKTVCFSITGTRKRNGLFKSLDELAKVPRFGTGCMRKYRDMLEV